MSHRFLPRSPSCHCRPILLHDRITIEVPITSRVNMAIHPSLNAFIPSGRQASSGIPRGGRRDGGGTPVSSRATLKASQALHSKSVSSVRGLRPSSSSRISSRFRAFFDGHWIKGYFIDRSAIPAHGGYCYKIGGAVNIIVRDVEIQDEDGTIILRALRFTNIDWG